MSDELIEAMPVFAVFAELVALGWAFARRNINAVVLVNALGAAVALFILVPELTVSFRLADILLLLQLVAFGFALATLVTSLSWFARPAGQPFAVWVEFSLITIVSVIFLMFMLHTRMMI